MNAQQQNAQYVLGSLVWSFLLLSKLVDICLTKTPANKLAHPVGPCLCIFFKKLFLKPWKVTSIVFFKKPWNEISTIVFFKTFERKFLCSFQNLFSKIFGRNLIVHFQSKTPGRD